MLRNLTLAGCLLLSTTHVSLDAQAPKYTISTYAGGAPRLPSSVRSMTTDSAGNLYFADYGISNSVFKLDSSGMLTRVAGNSRTGYSGDGGPAVSASLFSPRGIAIDATGNLYISDPGNGRVRKVTPDGIITTIAGGGSEVLEDGGPATLGPLNQTVGVAVDGEGNLFVGDSDRVRKVTPDGVITTIAGGGTDNPRNGGPATNAKLNSVGELALDGAGNLFIADYLPRDYDDFSTRAYEIRKVSPDGIITTLPFIPTCCTGIFAVDRVGNLFLPEFARILKISPTGDSTVVAGLGDANYGISGDGGPATQARVEIPAAVAVDVAGNLFIADEMGSRIRKVTPEGIITTVDGGILSGIPERRAQPSVSGRPATGAQLRLAVAGLGAWESGLAVDKAGNLFVAETGNHMIRKVSPDGILTTVAGVGPGCRDHLDVLPWVNDCVPPGDGGPATSAGLSLPMGLAIDDKNNLYIADYHNFRIRKVTPDGTITTVAGNGKCCHSGDGGPATSAQLSYPASVAIDGDGNLFILESMPPAELRKVSRDGIITTVPRLPGFGTTAITVDPAGNLVRALFECDGGHCNRSIQKISPAGMIKTVAVFDSVSPGPCTSANDFPSAQFMFEIAADVAGNVFFADTPCQRIRMLDANGNITTIAGGSTGYSGDGGPALDAALNYPYAMAVDNRGNVYLADGFNQAVRVLRPVEVDTSRHLGEYRRNR